jgi:ribonuclease G
LAEWLYEEGIGENRAILIEGDILAEAAIELPGTLRTGAVVPARIAAIVIPGRRAIVALDAGGEALLEPIPDGLAEGARIKVEITRESLAEFGRLKRAKARVAQADAQPGPSLHERLVAAGHKVTPVPQTGPDLFEQAGWSELLEEAASGEIPFPGGALRMSLSPAMTLFDVDGTLAPAALAVAGAEAAGRAIRRFAIGGSIGIDLPTLPAKDERQKAAAALDAVLPQPFERTAVNGFGFLQVVRRRERASLPELIQADPVGAAARALLRSAQRSAGHGARTLHAAPQVIARIEKNAPWLDALSRTLGAPVALQAEPSLAISAGHVHSQHP